MAIDSKIKRIAALSTSDVGVPLTLPEPDTSVDDIDRWMLGNMYQYDTSVMDGNWDYSTESVLTLKAKTSSNGLQVKTSVETMDVEVIS